VYIGRVVQTRYFEKENRTKILTEQAFPQVKGKIEIPDSAHCYIRVIHCHRDIHPYIKQQLQQQYFSYAGSNKEFRVIKNKIFVKCE